MYNPLPILPRRRRPNAFTLVELLIAIGVIAALMAILLPVLAGARRAGQKLECMSNLRKLTQAWQMYHAMNDGHIAMPTYYNAWTTDGLNISWVANGTDDEQAIRKGALWPYTQNLRPYRCPADNSPRLRSYAANSYLNGAQIGDAATSDLGWNADKYGRCPAQVADLRDASRTFLFTEESAPDENGFTVIPLGDLWQSFPANFHRDGVNLSFADGHVEYYRFADPRTARISQRRSTTTDNPDLKQFQAWIGVNLDKFRPPDAGPAGK